MSSASEVDPSLLEIFLEELDERVAALEADLLALERTTEPSLRSDLAASVFRSVHSLKGASHAVGARPLESFCHDLEARLAVARIDAGLLDASLIEALIAATDVLTDAGRRLRAGDAPETLVLNSAPSRVSIPRATEARPAAIPPLRASAPEAATGTETTVQVRTEVLDGFVALSGEAVVAREQLIVASAALSDLEGFIWAWRKAARGERGVEEQLAALDTLVTDRVARVSEAVHGHERVASVLDGRLRTLRLQPFALACAGLDRMVRDLAHAAGKRVDLQIAGQDLELDRAILSRLRDPIRHLVRNAVDHGVEAPEDRERVGKAPSATIVVSATLLGDRVEVAVADDGRGVDERSVLRHAANQGLPAPRDPGALGRLLFSAGFSTKAVVSKVSGRGVGLDAVRTSIEAMLGRVRVEWAADQGTRFILQVPISLATEHSVLVHSGGCTFALPSRDVRRAFLVRTEDLRSLVGQLTLVDDSGGRPVPVQDLAASLGLPVHARKGAPVAVVVASEDREVAFLVDEAIEARDLVMLTLGRRLQELPLIVGAAILGNGEIALLVDAARLVAAPAIGVSTLASPRAEAAAHAALPRVLVVDDSATTRSLLRSILETAGYEVALAVDGAEAWSGLQLRVPDLIVCDVDMPRMNGLDLCAAVRDSPRLRGVPFVLVTSLGTDRDRQRGMELGADAYIVKGEFDQSTLLDTVRGLLA